MPGSSAANGRDILTVADTEAQAALALAEDPEHPELGNRGMRDAEPIGEAWPLEQRAVLDTLRKAIDALHREALSRLLRGLREDPAAEVKLGEVAL